MQQGEERVIPVGWYPNRQDVLNQLALFSLLDIDSHVNETYQLVIINSKRPGNNITLPDDKTPSLL